MNQTAYAAPDGRTTVANGLAGLVLLLAAVSAGAGLFLPNLYRDPEAWIRQARAADLVTLFAVVPVLAIGLWRARAGSPVGQLAALAALGYLVYNYAIFGFSVAINPMTPVHIAVLGLSVWSLALSLVDLADRPLETAVGARLPRRTTTGFLLAVPAVFALMWLGQISQAITSGVLPEEVAKVGLPTNPIYTLDLALALPFLAVSGILLFRRSPWGAMVAVVALAWIVLMGLGLLAIFAMDGAAGAPVPLAVVAVISVITGFGLALITVGSVRARHGPVTSAAIA